MREGKIFVDFGVEFFNPAFGGCLGETGYACFYRKRGSRFRTGVCGGIHEGEAVVLEEPRVKKAERFSKIWWKSRADGGKSQEFMAMGLGVSRKTIQNWEKGTSYPDLFQGEEWFHLLGLNPIQYYIEFLYPWLFEGAASAKSDEQIAELLLQLISECAPEEKRQLLYLMTGNHGSSWHFLLQTFTAYCHTTMKYRVATARMIADTYEMEDKLNLLVCPETARPNLDVLKREIKEERRAVLDRTWASEKSKQLF